MGLARQAGEEEKRTICFLPLLRPFIIKLRNTTRIVSVPSSCVHSFRLCSAAARNLGPPVSPALGLVATRPLISFPPASHRSPSLSRSALETPFARERVARFPRAPGRSFERLVSRKKVGRRVPCRGD